MEHYGLAVCTASIESDEILGAGAPGLSVVAWRPAAFARCPHNHFSTVVSAQYTVLNSVFTDGLRVEREAYLTRNGEECCHGQDASSCDSGIRICHLPD
jgi:hypothetical protein